jgi:hypothetical protein
MCSELYTSFSSTRGDGHQGAPLCGLFPIARYPVLLDWPVPPPLLLRLPKLALDNLILQKAYPVLLKALRIASIHPARPPISSCSLVGFEYQSLAGRNTLNLFYF